MKPLLFSVVTPSYNQAQFVEETILSILRQDYDRIEYIIIDGGSTDGSAEIIRRYEKELAYWVSERDAGQSDAINKGWRKCTGDIVAYLNSDDVYVPGAVRKAIDFFAAHPEVDVLYGDRIVINERGHVKEVLPSPDFSPDTQIARSIPQECVFMRRRALEAVGYLNTELHYLMDYDLWLRMLRAELRFQHLPVPLGKYRIHSNAKYANQRVGFWPELIGVAENYLNSDPRVSPKVAQATRSQLYFQTGLELACGGKRNEGAQYVRQSFTYPVLPFGDAHTLATRATGIVVNALVLAQQDSGPEEIFDWLLALIPAIPARESIIAEVRGVRQRAAAEFHLARAFDDYGKGDYSKVGRNIVAGVRRHPAALKNRGVWAIAAKSLVNKNVAR